MDRDIDRITAHVTAHLIKEPLEHGHSIQHGIRWPAPTRNCIRNETLIPRRKLVTQWPEEMGSITFDSLLSQNAAAMMCWRFCCLHSSEMHDMMLCTCLQHQIATGTSVIVEVYSMRCSSFCKSVWSDCSCQEYKHGTQQANESKLVFYPKVWMKV